MYGAPQKATCHSCTASLADGEPSQHTWHGLLVHSIPLLSLLLIILNLWRKNRVEKEDYKKIIGDLDIGKGKKIKAA